jgi:thiol-disulfide isomerase/thioredoxin
MQKIRGGGLSPPSQHEILTRGLSPPEPPSPLLDHCIRKHEISKDFFINHKSQQYKPFCTPCKKYAESVFLVAAEHVYTHVYTSPGLVPSDKSIIIHYLAVRNEL